MPLGASTPVHTAWALDALIAAAKQTTPEMKAGFRSLIRLLRHPSWTASYPVGQGMAGAFYIHYHSYRYIFPLLALAHYEQKFGPFVD